MPQISCKSRKLYPMKYVYLINPCTTNEAKSREDNINLPVLTALFAASRDRTKSADQSGKPAEEAHARKCRRYPRRHIPVTLYQDRRLLI